MLNERYERVKQRMRERARWVRGLVRACRESVWGKLPVLEGLLADIPLLTKGSVTSLIVWILRTFPTALTAVGVIMVWRHGADLEKVLSGFTFVAALLALCVVSACAALIQRIIMGPSWTKQFVRTFWCAGILGLVCLVGIAGAHLFAERVSNEQERARAAAELPLVGLGAGLRGVRAEIALVKKEVEQLKQALPAKDQNPVRRDLKPLPGDLDFNQQLSPLSFGLPPAR